MKITIMGIVNMSPNSFSGDGLSSVAQAVKQALQMIDDGADIIDIGGESSRPGAKPVSVKEEMNRVLPVLIKVREELGDTRIDLSVDTYKSKVAEMALLSGADIINSLGGFTYDKELAEVIANYNKKIIIYHTEGSFGIKTKFEHNAIIKTVSDFFEKQIAYGTKNGIQKENIILDPGIGFAKKTEDSMTLLKNLAAFKKFKLPIAIGVSRKKHLGILLQEALDVSNIPDEHNRLEAALAETAVAIINGATVIRTHDVLVTKKFVGVLEELAF